jgi:hypothetical protein
MSVGRLLVAPITTLVSGLRRFTLAAAVVFSVVSLGLGREAAAQFQAGNLVVSQIGDGTTTSGSVAVPVTLREFTTSGSATAVSVALPTADSGSNYAFAGSMTSTSFGFLKRSTDGLYLTMAGSNIPAGTAVSPFSSSSWPNRVIARVDASGTVDSSTRFSAAGVTPRSAITTDGTNMWWSGDTGSGNTGGIRYLTLGSTTSGEALAQGSGTSSTTAGQPAPVPYNSRVLNIYNDQLYGSSGVTVGASGVNQISFRGVFNVGTGLPTTANQLGSLIVGSTASNQGNQDSAYDYFFANASTIYVGDDDTTAPATGGITKWMFDGSVWNKAWLALPAGATGVRGLAGVTNPISGEVELYGITAVASGQNQLVKMVDTLSGTIAPSFSTLATADANYVFRGVALAPVPEPSTVLVGVAGLAVIGGIGRWRTRQSRR